MGFEKPEKVRKAQQKGDIEALRNMGAAGGRKAAENNDIRREYKKHIEARRHMKDWEEKTAANEHLLTPDGEDVSEAHDALN